MKYLILFSALYVVVLGLNSEDAAAMRTMFIRMGEECKGESGVSPANINQLIQGKNPTTTEAKCFLACMHKRMGFQDGSGKLNMPGIDGWLNKISGMDAKLGEKMRQVADKCSGTIDESGDACDTAANIFDCYTRVSKEIGVPMLV